MTLIWIPLIWLMVKMVMKIIPDGKAVVLDTSRPLYLDSKLVAQPTAALQLVAKEIVHCMDLVKTMLSDITTAAQNEDKRLVEDGSKESRRYQASMNALQNICQNFLHPVD